MAKITEEEAIKRLKDKITTMEHGAISSNYGNDKELFQMAIEAMNENEKLKHDLEQIRQHSDMYRESANKLREKVGVLEDELAKKLEQEPCKDAVSRKAVLNQIFYSTDNSGDVVLGSNLRERIERLPSVTSAQRWIPVSERLPENDGNYLVVEKTGRTCSYVFHKEGNSEEYWKRCVIAWAPLPKLYNEIEHNLENSDQINSKNEVDEPEL